MRSYLVLFNELPIDKTSVKRGENSPQVIVAARCVNVALFLSNDLRRDVEVIIGITHEKGLKTITFKGETLRRASPDERSISFFLLKAVTALADMPEQMERVMDNGIVLKRTSLDELLLQWPSGQVFVASEDSGSPITECDFSEGLFIYPIRRDFPFSLDEYCTLQRPISPERFILDVNIKVDSRN